MDTPIVVLFIVNHFLCVFIYVVTDFDFRTQFSQKKSLAMTLLGVFWQALIIKHIYDVFSEEDFES